MGQTHGHQAAQAELHLMKKNIESWNVPGLYITFVFAVAYGVLSAGSEHFSQWGFFYAGLPLTCQV